MPGPILEGKGMCVIFQKNGKTRENIWKFKNVQNLKYFEKGQPHAYD